MYPGDGNETIRDSAHGKEPVRGREKKWVYWLMEHFQNDYGLLCSEWEILWWWLSFCFTSFCYVLNLIFGFGFVISLSIEIVCEHWYYSKRMRFAFVSKSLLLNSSVINSFSNGCITPYHCGIIHSFSGWVSLWLISIAYPTQQ